MTAPLSFELTMTVDSSLKADDREDLLHRFFEMIELNHLNFGGGGEGDLWFGVIEGDEGDSVTEAQRAAVDAWLREQPQVVKHELGPLEEGEPLTDDELDAEESFAEADDEESPAN